jgi:mRNA interferase MazF
MWITFNPQAGHEQAGRRPAVVLSPVAYNRKVGLALLCPITSQAKGYPFEVAVPGGLPVTGVVLADQVKSLDWQAREAEFACALPAATIREILQRIGVLLAE